MAEARKCDKCEKFFDIFNFTGRIISFYNPSIYTSNDIKNLTVTPLFSGKLRDERIDLCVDCSKKFIAFMNNWEGEPDDDEDDVGECKS